MWYNYDAIQPTMQDIRIIQGAPKYRFKLNEYFYCSECDLFLISWAILIAEFIAIMDQYVRQILCLGMPCTFWLYHRVHRMLWAKFHFKTWQTLNFRQHNRNKTSTRLDGLRALMKSCLAVLVAPQKIEWF